MASRSRNGCVDCKRAKVKCDEVHPSCGTCKRRGRQCSGYNHSTKAPKTRHAGPWASSLDAQYPSNIALSPAASLLDSIATTSPSSPKDAHTDIPLRLQPVTIIPPGTIHPADEPFIEVYFTRHPKELVFGPEFVDEMNSSVMKVFQNSPLAVSDSLSAIGEAYVRGGSLPAVVPIPSRKARILARLRGMDSPGASLELLLTVMLGLCAVELIDANDHEHHVSSLPALLENLAMMLDRHICQGNEISQLAKYFIRALARQDMMLSLTRFHRPRIPTVYWLDDHSQHQADRFMGYTATLMPLLGELSALAEDLYAFGDDNFLAEDLSTSPSLSPPHDLTNILDRASQLQLQLELWQPTVDPALSFQSSRKFLMHASAYRSAALLYLHRLLHPPGSSAEADRLGLAMAYQVMVHTTTSDDEMKMSLWPVFLASCEVNSKDDRTSAMDMFGSICRIRKTVTATRTRTFVTSRVWAARDAGLDWNWMILSLQYPSELLPI